MVSLMISALSRSDLTSVGSSLTPRDMTCFHMIIPNSVYYFLSQTVFRSAGKGSVASIANAGCRQQQISNFKEQN